MEDFDILIYWLIKNIRFSVVMAMPLLFICALSIKIII